MISTPDKITESTTLGDLARLLDAFGLMLTCKPISSYRSEATASDSDGVIGSGVGATIAEAIREAVVDFLMVRRTYDTGRKP